MGGYYEEFNLDRNLNQMRQLEDEQAIFVPFHDNADVIQVFSRLSRTVNAATQGWARPKYLT